MHPDKPVCPRSLSRRGFLFGAGAGLLAGAPLAYLGWKLLNPTVTSPVKLQATDVAMPGLYPARVVEVHHPRAVVEIRDKKAKVPRQQIDRQIVRQMMDNGMRSLTGADHPDEAWKRFFEPGDVIGIKLNPVGRRNDRYDLAESISNREVVLETVRNLRQIGVPAKNIILFERYANEFVAAGYADLLTEREMDGVRWFASAAGYTNEQLAIDGVEDPTAHSPELLRHVVGYDPDCFVNMGFADKEHDSRDDRRTRSHLSVIVSRMINKMITLPVLKDHRSAGITLSLKNMSHGMNNNVARSHIGPTAHGFSDSPGSGVSGPNMCGTFIPAAVNQPLLKQKATLHILDGLIGVYEGGPGNWNKTWGTWRANSLFFATDPVALDHIGWDIVDSKRRREGLPLVGDMGRDRYTDQHKIAMAMANFAATNLRDGLPLIASEKFVRGGGDSEVFDRRQPEHVIAAGLIGLGEFDLTKITYERLKIG